MVQRKLYLSIAIWLFVLAVSSTNVRGATGEYLPKSTSYPRLVRMMDGNNNPTDRIVAATTGQLFESKDDGRAFTYLADAPVQPGSKLRCCETIYQLPSAVGKLSAGTLLYSGTYVRDHVPAIEIYASTDGGHHWTYQSTPVTRGDDKGGHGLWEPHFTVTRNGSLAMFWSDETFDCCSQKLMQIRTSDGEHWQDESDTVESTVRGDRPGMPVVNRLPTGSYFMSYEICGDPMTGHKCAAYFRTSRDGWNYGSPFDLGARIESASGQFFEHAPASLWSPSPIAANGVIVVVGQVLHNADNSIAAENGKVLFVNPLLDGTGPWSVIPSPVAVPYSYDNFCPNYSSALLPVQNGTALLEMATDYRAVKECGAYFETKSWKDLTTVKPNPAQAKQ
jgi:hypothetical protein